MLSPREYFDSVAQEYHKHYDTDPMDMSMPYPANNIRRKMLFESFKDVRKPIDVGGGDGTILEHWTGGCGFDISPRMVEIARAKHGDRFIQADITKPETYAPLRAYGPFDGLIAMGVMPHISNTEYALKNMIELAKGKFFVEFRNSLFALFTFNKYTIELMMNELVHPLFRQETYSALKKLLPDLPKERPYDQILSGFHNPLEMADLFEKLGFHDINILWYHYHPTIPWLDNGKAFREAALEMEGKPSWKSMLQCSAFVIEATHG